MNRDRELIRQCLEGGLDAFRLLIEPHQARVRRIAASVLGDREEAEEAAQDAFVRIYKGLGTFRGEVDFGVWACRVAVNTCYNAARKRRYRRRMERVTDPARMVEYSSSDLGNPERVTMDRETGARIREIIRKLPKKLHEVVVLSLLDEMSHDEVSQALSIPVGTVKSRLHLARKRLASDARRKGLID